MTTRLTSLAELVQVHLGLDGVEMHAVLLQFLADWPDLARVPEPDTPDPVIRACAASMVELLARHAGQAPPAWTSAVPGLELPQYLGMGSMLRNPRLVAMAHEDAPQVLRKRNIFSMGEYLTVA
jgi:hypothetical protein